jgi:cadmium resistance protein CadD (predicted permease)
VNELLAAVGLGVGAFLGTGIDNFFAVAAQLIVTDPQRYRRVRYAYVAGMATLLGFAGAIGSALSIFSVRWIGLLALAPIGLAIAQWRGRTSALEAQRRGAVTTFAVTLALGGDNIAIWIPLLRSQGVFRGVAVAVTILLLTMVSARLAQILVTRPSLVRFGERWAAKLTPFLYLALAVVIMWQCQWLSFLD